MDSTPWACRGALARPGPRQTSTLPLMLTSARPPTRAWEVARTVVAPPLSVVKCLWEVFVWGSCRARVCAGVGGVFSVGVSCVRVTCWLFYIWTVHHTQAEHNPIRVNPDQDADSPSLFVFYIWTVHYTSWAQPNSVVLCYSGLRPRPCRVGLCRVAIRPGLVFFPHMDSTLHISWAQPNPVVCAVQLGLEH